MVHGLRLRGGRAEWYRNRYVRNPETATALGEVPPSSGVAPHGGMDFAANTNVIAHAGRTLAIVEAGGRPYELTDELETVGIADFEGTLPNGFTAHPKLDPTTGELHAVCYWWGFGNQVQYVVVGPDGRVTRAEMIPTLGATMLHDMSLTERYAVVYDQPVVFDLDLAQAERFPYSWAEDYPIRLGLVPRDGSATDTTWFELEPGYVFHPMNAYDEGDRVVLDVVRHPRMFDTRLNGPDEGPPSLWRWTLDRTSGKALEEQLDDRGQEFPRVDERRVGRRHRFGYAAGAGDLVTGGDPVGGLVKHDLVAGSSEFHAFGPGNGAAEGVFVPRSADAAEDDGWVMALVYDADRGASDLVVLDAQDFSGEPVARVHLPVRVPFGFHGNWIPA
jgi:carotenoid cleavage dioxygenase